MNCKHCEKEFTQTRYAEKYCSEECRRKFWYLKKLKPPRKVVCGNCRVEFTTSHGHQKYCAMCKRKHHEPNIQKVICAYCSKVFETSRSLRYVCSRKCYWDFQSLLYHQRTKLLQESEEEIEKVRKQIMEDLE